MLKIAFLMLALGGLAGPCAHAEARVQTLDSIYAFVKATIEHNMSSSGEHEIQVLPLDAQLNLAECAQPLEAYKTHNLIKAGRVSIGVHCGGEKKWTVFVSAVIKAYESVIVLTQPVRRGDIITRQHLSLERRDISSAQGDYATQFEQIENKEAARNLPGGAIVGLKSVTEPPLIKRKDKVVIRSSGDSGFSVQMNGTALMDGAKGQIIKVKNESSGRVVSGMVLEAGVVVVR
jgi:flagella basal body P-ring formation protein FlgA